MPKLTRALLVGAIVVTSQLDRCTGCGCGLQQLQHVPAPAALVRPLVAAR